MHAKSPLEPREDPLEQFELWFAEASESAIRLPDAVALATVDSGGRAAVRMVLYKGISDGGLTFFTNYESRKGQHLQTTGYAAMVFYWEPLERQVRFEGPVSRLSAAQSDAYFATRSRASRVAARASIQSRPYRERTEILERYAEIDTRFKDTEIPRPDFWGGYKLVPERAEFWTGMPHRFHDRVEFRRSDGGWEWCRLQP